MSQKVRLYVDQPFAEGQTLPLTRDQATYLFAVMRLPVGEIISVINGRDGEWDAEILRGTKRGGDLVCRAQTRPMTLPPDLWLIFAPIKKVRTDFIVEKATELGVRRILPVQTDFTQGDRVRRDRLQAHAVEAAEQCGATFVPEVDDLRKLDEVLRNWPDGRQVIFCDEARAGMPAGYPEEAGPAAILIGPEGGFSDSERTALLAAPFASAVSLGPRILRADTAAIAAITLWQSRLGDWR